MSLKLKHLSLAALFVSLPLMASDSQPREASAMGSDSKQSMTMRLVSESQARMIPGVTPTIKALRNEVKNEFEIFFDRLQKLITEGERTSESKEYIVTIVSTELEKIVDFGNPEKKLFTEELIGTIFSSNNFSKTATEVLDEIKWNTSNSLDLIRSFRHAITEMTINLSINGYRLPK